MPDKNTVRNYLLTQGLKLPLTDVLAAALGFNAITSLDSNYLSEILTINRPLTLDREVSFNQGILKPDALIPYLHPLADQQHLFLKLCALLDSANEQQAGDYFTLYITPNPCLTAEKSALANPLLLFCAGTYRQTTHQKHLNHLFFPNSNVKQVAQTGWLRMVNDLPQWQELHGEAEMLQPASLQNIGSEIILPLYANNDHDAILGILYIQNRLSHTINEEKQIILVALALVLADILSLFNWQSIH